MLSTDVAKMMDFLLLQGLWMMGRRGLQKLSSLHMMPSQSPDLTKSVRQCSASMIPISASNRCRSARCTARPGNGHGSELRGAEPNTCRVVSRLSLYFNQVSCFISLFEPSEGQ